MATDATRRLHHRTPPWVANGAMFHIRCRVIAETGHPLTEPQIGKALLDSAAFYHEQGSWYCHLLLLMPDHWHALLCFPPDSAMSTLLGRWKSWQKRTISILWQENYFDHRIRDDAEFERKSIYIRNNPVAKGLCANAADWPWVIDAASLSQNSR